MSALRAEHLAARYPGQPLALADVDLEVQTGERLLLLGPNGAGKSTFIRVFAGLMHAAAGKALIGGRLAREARSQVGVVTHTTLLYDELTALENLRLYAALYGVDAERAAEVLELVGLAHLAHRPVGRLSRGQQQRVAIARALIHDPPVLLLDEPDTGLDVGALGILETLLASRTVVLTTHNMAAGLRLCTRAAILSGGRLVHTEPRVSADDGAGLAERLDALAR